MSLYLGFLVSGEEKAETLGNILTEPTDVNRFPASAVRPTNGRLTWRVDEAAFSKTDERYVRGYEIHRFD